MVISTCQDGTPPEMGATFYEQLKELSVADLKEADESSDSESDGSPAAIAAATASVALTASGPTLLPWWSARSVPGNSLPAAVVVVGAIPVVDVESRVVATCATLPIKGAATCEARKLLSHSPSCG